MSILKNPIGWFEIYVEDLERSKYFYETVFERSLVPMPTDGSFEALVFSGEVTGSGAMGAIICHPMRKPSRDGTLIYFSCEDCDRQIERAKNHGGAVYKEKHNIGDAGYIAIIGDTEGNAIGLHSFQ